jgi:endonuclease G, mitochondrial
MIKSFFLLLLLYNNIFGNEFISITSPYTVKCVKYKHFTTCYSNDLNRSVYSVEDLTATNLRKAIAVPRVDKFHEDPVLKTHILHNFVGSRYDKGHSVACGNMPTVKSQYESFSMANMIPQHYSNNRGNWKSLENKERSVTLALGKTTVVSGTFGSNGSLKTSDIPKYVFKIIKSGDYMKVYIINNDGTQDINITDIDSLSKISGYTFKY